MVDANERDQLLVWILVAFHNWWVRAFRDGPELAGRARAEIAARWQARGNELQDWWMRIGDFNIRMIEGDAEAAHRGISQSFLEGWKQRAFASRFHYLEGRMMVGRGALALATVDEARRPKLLEEVASVCEELRAERSAWTLALALGLEAGVTSLGGDPAATHAALQRTIAAADEAGLVFIAASARLELSFMDDDADLRAEAMRFFEAGQVAQPAWGTRYMLPGRFRVHEMR